MKCAPVVPNRDWTQGSTQVEKNSGTAVTAQKAHCIYHYSTVYGFRTCLPANPGHVTACDDMLCQCGQ